MRAALGLLLCLLPAAAAGRTELSRRVALRGGAVEIRVRFDEDQAAWGAYQLRQAAAYLPAVEAYLGTSLQQAAPAFFAPGAVPSPFVIAIEGQRQVLLGGAWIGAYNNSAGLFAGPRAIFVEYGLTLMGRPALVLHELGHFWLYDSAGVTKATPGAVGASWFHEGAASQLPLALVQARLLQLTPEECRSIGETWGLDRVPLRIDAPIEQDLRPDGGTRLLLFYQKAFQTHALLRQWLGPAGYRGLLQAAARSPASLRSPDGVLALLGGAAPLPWRYLLGGWVYAGPYGPIGPAAFARLAVRADGTIPLPAPAAKAPPGARPAAPAP